MLAALAGATQGSPLLSMMVIQPSTIETSRTAKARRRLALATGLLSDQGTPPFARLWSGCSENLAEMCIGSKKARRRCELRTGPCSDVPRPNDPGTCWRCSHPGAVPPACAVQAHFVLALLPKRRLSSFTLGSQPKSESGAGFMAMQLASCMGKLQRCAWAGLTRNGAHGFNLDPDRGLQLQQISKAATPDRLERREALCSVYLGKAKSQRTSSTSFSSSPDRDKQIKGVG